MHIVLNGDIFSGDAIPEVPADGHHESRNNRIKVASTGSNEISLGWNNHGDDFCAYV